MKFTIIKVCGGGDKGDQYRYVINKDSWETTTVGELKSDIASITSIPSRHQKLILMGEVLQYDHVTMGSIALRLHHLNGLNFIHLVPKSRNSVPFFSSKAVTAATQNSNPTASIATSDEQRNKRQRAEYQVYLKTIPAKKVIFSFSDPSKTSVQSLLLAQPYPDKDSDFVYNGICLKERDYMLSDYGINGENEILHLILRSRHQSVANPCVEERRIRRLIGPMLHLHNANAISTTPSSNAASLYPHLLNRLNIQSKNDPIILFHAIKETIAPILMIKQQA